MSLAIKTAKGYTTNGAYGASRPMGDPGLLSFLGKVAKGVVGGVTGFISGGPTGAIMGAARGAGLLPGVPNPPAPRALLPAGTVGTVAPFVPGGPFIMGPGFPGGPPIPGSGVQVGGGFKLGPIQIGGGAAVGTFPAGGQPAGPPGMQCGGGTHLNRGRYALKGGQVVQPGSRCVKNRRMNPLNPDALSRSMRRLVSFKRATKIAARISIRKKC